MKRKLRSVVSCALLLTVSVIGMRVGRDRDYIPAKSYAQDAREVLLMLDEQCDVSAMSTSSFGNLSRLLAGEECAEAHDIYDAFRERELLEPIVRPSESGLLVSGAGGD